MKRIIFTYCQIIAALLLFVSSAHAITWEDRGGEAIRLGVVTATTTTPTGTYYSVTENGVIAESRDGGVTWAPVSLPQSGIHFNSVKFFDDTHGIAVGDNNLAYLNGGTSWQVVSRPGTKMNAVDMSDATTAHIACDGGILVYTLGTGNFRKASVESTNYNSVSFHGGVGYACGDGGRVAKYTDGEWKLLNNPDGGYDWVKYVLRTSGALTHIVASDRQTAYAMTDDGRLIKTIDGGLSWSERESGTGKGISSMSLIPGGDIAITGDGGRSYRLSDGTDRYSVRYYYDELGRIAASQTSRQQAMTPQRYSYISYDAIGRTVEAGEIEAQTPPTQALMRSPEYPGNWGARRRQVVHTFYDKPQYSSVTARFEEGVQENLRNRISSVIYMDEYDSEMLRYDHATHYSYDIHGNVKELLQEDRSLAAYGDDYAFHSIRYDYDLVSGNVNQVDYQNGQPDQFSMFYEYDSENRIQKVMSQFPGDEEPQTDATYEYYRHGPLARTVLGNGVQGMDYAYTLQGWVKGMNSENLGAEQDMGGDGKNGVASDVVGYTLSYNFNDYKPIAKGQTADFYKAVSEQDMTNLYTGNISRMATALANPHLEEKNWTQVRDFHYDVLNRLKSSTVQGSSAYATTYSYDANGNITELTRNNANGDNFDKLTYRYEQDAEGNFINNRLLHVRDNADKPNAIETDIKDQGVYAQNDPAKRNYAYDQQGNLISDKAEEIANIEWTATGKVRRITRTAQSRKPDLEFRYDALGNRVSKTVISKTDGTRTTTYYVRDAKGTTLATYTEAEGKLHLSEQHLYGAKRLGMRSSNQLVASTNGGNSTQEESNGEKRYELTNHLGNVLAVVSENKAEDGSAQILSLTDYYPFGMEMGGRKYEKLTADGYRYGFTGHEKEFDLANDIYTTDFRLLDTRIGRWLSVDPLADKYAGMSPYNYCDGNPVEMVDKDGKLPVLALVFKAGANAASDWLMQTAVNYYFNPETAGDLESSFSDVNGWQIARSGLEGLCPWKVPGGKYGKAAATASADVMVNFLKSPDDYSTEQAIEDFTIGFLGDLAGEQIGEFITKYGFESIAKGLSRLGFDDKKIESILGKGTTWKGPCDYTDIKDPKNAAPYKKFTTRQKQEIHEKNKSWNNGYERSDLDGTFLNKAERGGNDPLQAEVDHIIPRSKGGSNTSDNVQILSKEQNLRKLDH